MAERFSLLTDAGVNDRLPEKTKDQILFERRGTSALKVLSLVAPQ